MLNPVTRGGRVQPTIHEDEIEVGMPIDEGGAETSRPKSSSMGPGYNGDMPGVLRDEESDYGD